MKRPTVAHLDLVAGHHRWRPRGVLVIQLSGLRAAGLSVGSVPVTVAPLVAALAPYALFLGILMLVLGVAGVVFGIGAWR